MPDDRPPNAVDSSLSTPSSYWPWGQIGWLLTGIAFSLMGIADVGVLLGRINLASGDGLKATGSLLLLLGLGCSVPAVLITRKIKRRGGLRVHVPWLRKVNFGLLAVTVSMIMLSLIIPATHTARVAHAEAIAAGPWIDHAFGNAAFQISTPANWELFSDPAVPSSGIRLVDRQNDLHLVVSVTPKQDLAAQTLAELSQQAAATLGKDAKDFAFGESQRTEVDGQQAIDQVVIGTFDGLNLCCYLRHAEYPNTWIDLRLWATRSRFDGNQDSIVKIVASIRRRQ